MKHRPVALTAALALVLSACSTPQNDPDPLPTVASDAPGSQTVQPPGEASHSPILREDPNPHMTPGGTKAQQEVALEAARIMTRWNPTEDTTRTDAELRARHLMTKDRAGDVIAPERPATGADWIAAQQAQATSTPTVELNEAVDGGAVEVHATWTWTTPDGEELPNTEQTVRYFRFVFDKDDPDKISEYTYADRPAR